MRLCLATLLIMSAIAPAPSAAAEEPLVEKYLLDGKLADGEKALADVTAANPTDAQARFGLGVIQFVCAVERMVQTFHRYGLRDTAGDMLPFARAPSTWFSGSGATAAMPYLQNGVCTSAETWNRFQRIFRGEFIGFAPVVQLAAFAINLRATFMVENRPGAKGIWAWATFVGVLLAPRPSCLTPSSVARIQSPIGPRLRSPSIARISFSAAASTPARVKSLSRLGWPHRESNAARQ